MTDLNLNYLSVPSKTKSIFYVSNPVGDSIRFHPKVNEQLSAEASSVEYV